MPRTRRWPIGGRPLFESSRTEGDPAVAAGNTAPVITSVTFDQASYPPGAKITATVNYTPGSSQVSFTASITVTDSANGQTASKSAGFAVTEADPTSVTGFSDTGSRTWTKVSDSGGVAVFTATA